MSLSAVDLAPRMGSRVEIAKADLDVGIIFEWLTERSDEFLFLWHVWTMSHIFGKRQPCDRDA